MRMAAFIGAEGDWRLKPDEQILFPRRYRLLDKLHTKSGKRMRLRFNVQIVPALIRIDDEASLRCAPAHGRHALPIVLASRSEEHTSELQSLMRISYAVFCLKKQKNATHKQRESLPPN